MAHQQTLKTGTELIGDFRILDLLGSGGFANTYLATDITLGREVAIKEFFPSELAVRADSQSVSVKSAAQEVQFKWALGRFVREAKTLAKFRHPSVVRVFRVFNANDTAYIVLEFVRGANMETWLKRIQRRPDQDELDHFLPPLLDALEVVHDAGILHRDIKPANIYIREAERTPVLLDFGAAKYATANAGDQAATTAAIVSKGYSPHEAYSTEAHLQGPWTDIYGLAATLHRGLTGSAPMESTTRILQDDFVPLDERPELAGKYRADFLKSINRALGVMPKDRPQSIAEWRAELYPGLTPASQPSAASAAGGGAKAEWHPLSDTPSNATTIYTGGSSRPSQAVGSQPPSQSSSGTSASRDALSGEKSSITAATRVAFQNVVKNQSRTVVTGWLLAIAGASGLALPFILGGDGKDAARNVALTDPKVEVARVDSKSSTPRPSVAPPADNSTGQATPETARATALREQAERQKDSDRQRAVEKQRTEWQRQRLQLQADLARQRSEDATKLAARRADEREKAAAEAERNRQAKLAEDRQRRAEAKKAEEARQAEEARLAAAKAAAEKAAADARERERLAAEKAAADKVATEKAAAEQRERERIAREAEQRRQEELEKQRLAAAAKEREAREKAAAEAREQERQRLARRAELAEKARLEREKERAGTQEQKYAALDPATPPITTPPPAVLDRKPYLTKVQTALKDAQCYSGAINGELSDTEAALKKFQTDYKGDAKSLSLKTANANEYDAWLTWFRSLEKFGCITPRQNRAFEKPATTTKTRKARTKTRSKPKAKTKKRAKSKTKSRPKKKTAARKRSKPKSRSYGSGSTSRSILRGTR